MPKGKNFNPEEYVIVQDKDEYIIDILGNYDINTEGTYNISVVATDISGNKSEEKNLQIIVEDRDNCTVRNAKLGDDIDTIKRYESAELVVENNDESGLFLMYEDVVAGEDAYIVYQLNHNEELYCIIFSFIESHTDHSLYINTFYNITEQLTERYGEPHVEKFKGSLYNYCDSEVEALNIGQVKYRNTWKTNDMKITLFLAKDNYEISFLLAYDSKLIAQPDNSDF